MVSNSQNEELLKISCENPKPQRDPLGTKRRNRKAPKKVISERSDSPHSSLASTYIIVQDEEEEVDTGKNKSNSRVPKNSHQLNKNKNQTSELSHQSKMQPNSRYIKNTYYYRGGKNIYPNQTGREKTTNYIKPYPNPQTQQNQRNSKFLLMSIAHNDDQIYINHRLDTVLNTHVDLREIKRFTDKNNNYHLIFECPSVFKEQILQLQKLELNGRFCTIRSFQPARRCSKCQSYLHSITNCPCYHNYCGICAGNHTTIACHSDYFRCINCRDYNEKNYTNFPTNHVVSDPNCKVYHLMKQQSFNRLF